MPEFAFNLELKSKFCRGDFVFIDLLMSDKDAAYVVTAIKWEVILRSFDANANDNDNANANDNDNDNDNDKASQLIHQSASYLINLVTFDGSLHEHGDWFKEEDLELFEGDVA